jgi:hypothetical protein
LVRHAGTQDHVMILQHTATVAMGAPRDDYMAEK